MKAAGKCPPLFIPPPVSSPCLRCGVEPRRGLSGRGTRALRSLGASELLQRSLLGTNCLNRPAPCKVPLSPVTVHPRSPLPRPSIEKNGRGGAAVA
jgi:hypothetical protein